MNVPALATTRRVLRLLLLPEMLRRWSTFLAALGARHVFIWGIHVVGIHIVVAPALNLIAFIVIPESWPATAGWIIGVVHFLFIVVTGVIVLA